MSLHLVHTQAGTSPAIRELSGSAVLSLRSGMCVAEHFLLMRSSVPWLE